MHETLVMKRQMVKIQCKIWCHFGAILADGEDTMH